MVDTHSFRGIRAANAYTVIDMLPIYSGDLSQFLLMFVLFVPSSRLLLRIYQDTIPPRGGCACLSVFPSQLEKALFIRVPIVT